MDRCETGLIRNLFKLWGYQVLKPSTKLQKFECQPRPGPLPMDRSLWSRLCKPFRAATIGSAVTLTFAIWY